MLYKVVREITKEEFLLFGDLGLPVRASYNDPNAFVYIFPSNTDPIEWEKYKSQYLGWPYHILLEEVKDLDVQIS